MHVTRSSGQMSKILFNPDNIEYYYDTHHSNAINFKSNGHYLSIQRSIVIDENDNPIFKKCNFTTSDGNLIGYIDIDKVEFKKNSIIISFSSILANGLSGLEVCLIDEIDAKLIDFFVNYLFLGDFAEFSSEIDVELHIAQVLFQEII